MDNKKQSSGMLGAAVAGAAVGAAAVFLANKENRKKVTKTIQGIKKDGEKKIKQLQETAEDVTEKGRKLVNDELKKAGKKQI